MSKEKFTETKTENKDGRYTHEVKQTSHSSGHFSGNVKDLIQSIGKKINGDKQ